MRKTVSTIEGFSLHIDDEGFVLYKTGQHMNGKEIGDVLNISKVAVSYSLRRAIKKVYDELRYKNISHFDVFCSMGNVFNLKTVEEYKWLLNCFSKEIRRKVNEEARELFC